MWVSCTCSERLSAGGRNLGHSTSPWSLLHRVCCYHCGEDAFAPEGARWPSFVSNDIWVLPINHLLCNWESFHLVTDDDQEMHLLNSFFVDILKISHPEEVITPETVEDLPPLTKTLLSVILASPSVCRWICAVLSGFKSYVPVYIVSWSCLTIVRFKKLICCLQGIFDWSPFISGLWGHQLSQWTGSCPAHLSRHQKW